MKNSKSQICRSSLVARMSSPRKRGSIVRELDSCLRRNDNTSHESRVTSHKRRIWCLGFVIFALCAGCGPVQRIISVQPDLVGAPNITGRVVDLVSQEPVQDVAISVMGGDQESKSDAEGNYSLSGLTPGIYTIEVHHERYLTALYPEIEVKEGAMKDLTIYLRSSFDLAADEGLIEGSVKDPAGNMLTGVIIGDLEKETSTVTGSEGLFILPLKVGRHNVTLIPPSQNFYGHDLKNLFVKAKEILHVDFTLSVKVGSDVAYVGSAACNECHQDVVANHAESLHKKSYQELTAESNGIVPSAITAFSEDRDLTLFINPARIGREVHAILSLSGGQPVVKLVERDGDVAVFPVAAVIGGFRWKQRFITRIGESRYVLPVQYNIDQDGDPEDPSFEGEWVGYNVGDWYELNGFLKRASVTGSISVDKSVEKNCLSCHSTGLKLSTNNSGEMTAEMAEINIGCERCHGAGGDHVSSKDKMTIENPAYRSHRSQVGICGQCHFEGDDRDRSEKERFLSGVHGRGDVKLVCTACHDSHGPAEFTSQLRKSPEDNSLCLSCHTRRNFPTPEAIQDHIGDVHPLDPAGPTMSGRCTACHWPKTEKVAQYNKLSGAGDAAFHGGNVIAPDCSVFERVGADVVSNGLAKIDSCLECHAKNWFLSGREGRAFSGFAGDSTNKTYCETREDRFDFLFNSGSARPHPASEVWDRASMHGRAYLQNKDTCTTNCHGGAEGERSTGVSCADCHINVPHVWADEVEHGREYERNPSGCKSCHGNDLGGGNVGVNCTSCHTSEVHPDYDSYWWRWHGEEYKDNPANCRSCHGANLQGRNLSNGVGCYDCHRDYPHQAEWTTGRNRHKETLIETRSGRGYISERRLEDCQLCHGDDFKREVAVARGETSKNCYECHNYPHNIYANWASETPGADRNLHSSEGRSMRDRADCAACHIDEDSKWTGGSERGYHGTSCYDCHTNFPHNADWVDRSEHGYEARDEFELPLSQRGIDCSVCHGSDYQGGTAEIGCYGCHSEYPKRHLNGNWDDGNGHGEYLSDGAGLSFTSELSKCADCHLNWSRSPFVPFPSSPPEIPADPPDTTSAGDSTCYGCHQSYPHFDWAGRAWERTGHQYYIRDPINAPASCDSSNSYCHGSNAPASRRPGPTTGATGPACSACH